MPKQTLEAITTELRKISENKNTSGLIYKQGYSLYLNGQCSRLSASESHFEFSVNDTHGNFIVKVDTKPIVHSSCTCRAVPVCRHRTAALMQLHELIKLDIDPVPEAGIKYTREGMIKRVTDERRKKALRAKYTIQYADNIFGEHLLINEKGMEYLLTFRDLKNQTGYCSCPDYRTNKLGTCKHLMFAFNHLQKKLVIDQSNPPVYPFIEVFLNPLSHNKITWYYPDKLYGEVAELFYKYFGNKNYMDDDDAEKLLGFFNNLDRFRQILVRPEVYDKVKNISELKTLQRAEQENPLDFSGFKTNLLPYQKEGVRFATFRKGAVIADELGLGKTIQAIATALYKKEILGFGSTLVICPGTLKKQWVEEIINLTHEKPLLIEGSPDDRKQQYFSTDHFFKVVSYETVLRDKGLVSELDVDFIILDEAQRLRDYASKTSSTIKSIQRKHTLVLTGTPIESELIELYSIVLFVDPELLAPLWEFSYEHCYFDSQTQNTIVGYYNLSGLKQRLRPVLIRRKRKDVIKQLPNLDQVDVPVKLTSAQKKLHIRFAREIIQVLEKKIVSSYDLQRVFKLISNLRMVANAAFLVDKSAGFSPKIDELKHLLLSKIHIQKNNHRVAVFTEWKEMQNMISRMLTINKLPYFEVPANPKKINLEELSKFQILLAGPDSVKFPDSSYPDIFVNMEAPKSARERNGRFGKIDELNKTDCHFTIINLIAENALEAKINDGLEIEFNLADKLFGADDKPVSTEMNAHLRHQLTSALKDSIEQMILSDDAREPKPVTDDGQMRLYFDEDEPEIIASDHIAEMDNLQQKKQAKRAFITDKNTMDELIDSGLTFISKLLKAGTGQNINLEKDRFEFDAEAGKINLILKFKETD